MLDEVKPTLPKGVHTHKCGSCGAEKWVAAPEYYANPLAFWELTCVDKHLYVKPAPGQRTHTRLPPGKPGDKTPQKAANPSADPTLPLPPSGAVEASLRDMMDMIKVSQDQIKGLAVELARVRETPPLI